MNTKQINEVAMKVNPANLVKSLRFSFTNKTTVLAELMQNARRARATQVNFNFCPETQTLQVTDDGGGIDSIETLLTVAESGWDAELVAQEHPYGIGFLSALFACRHIRILSKSGSIDVDTDAVLAFKPVAIQPVKEWDGMTLITLREVGFDADSIIGALRRFARGFPIPVIFNGDRLDRSAALDSGLDFVATGIGAIYLHGLQEPMGAQYAFELFLQGLPIYSSHSYSSERHVIHLDSARFHARLPDRDKLVDEVEVIKQVKSILKQEIEIRLRALKDALSPEEFVCFYEMIRHWGLLGLLNDVPVVPREVLCEINDYPVCDTEVYSSHLLERDAPLPFADVADGLVQIVAFGDDVRYDGAARAMFAWKRGSLVYRGGLDKDHWLQPFIRDLDAEEMTIELVNETHGANFEGEWVWIYARFCDSYRIKIGNEVVEIFEDALYEGEDGGGGVIVPSKDASGYVLKQVSNYRDEYDGFQESAHESDRDAFQSFVVANTAKDPAQALKRLLPYFGGCPSLYGKAFSLTLDEKGNVKAVAVLPNGMDALPA